MAAKRSTSAKKEKGGTGRLILWLLTRVVLPLAVIYGFIWWRVDAGVSNMMSQLSPIADVRRGASFVGLNGDVGINRVRLATRSASPTQFEFQADRVTFHTPGLFWLVKAGLFGVDEKSMPDRFGATLTNFAFDSKSADSGKDHSFGAYSGALFESVGCGQPSWSRQELKSALGLPIGASEIKWKVNRMSGDAIQFLMSGGTPGAGIGEVDIIVTAPGYAVNPSALAAATLTAASITFRDEGFIAARNAYCAKQANISVDAFIDKHIQAVRETFRSESRTVPDEPLEAAYRQYVTKGGEIVLRTRPQPGFMLASAQGYSSDQWRYYLSPIVEVPGRDPVLLTFKEASRADAESTADTAATPAATTTTAVAPGAAPATSAAPALDAAMNAAAATNPAPPPVQEARPLVTFGGGKNAYAVQPVDYAELRQAVGREIVVRTQNGTTRRGVLARFSNSQLDVQVNGSSGFQLSIPQRDVRDVGLVVDTGETAAAAPVQGNGNAKKN